MGGATIHYQVDLVIQLIDTTNGQSVTGVGITVTKNGFPFEMLNRGGGNYVALNVGREDFTLGIKTNGYEDCELEINYEKLDKTLPIQVVFLIPKENIGSGEPILSLSGSLEGIESIEGVCLSRPYCAISDYNEKKRQMTVFRPQGILSMEDVFYGLINKGESYERFQVVGKVGDSVVKTAEVLENGFSVNAPIAKVTFGSVKGNEYIFRVRDDATIISYLICYKVKGEKRFCLVDMHKTEQISLS